MKKIIVKVKDRMTYDELNKLSTAELMERKNEQYHNWVDGYGYYSLGEWKDIDNIIEERNENDKKESEIRSLI